MAFQQCDDVGISQACLGTTGGGLQWSCGLEGGAVASAFAGPGIPEGFVCLGGVTGNSTNLRINEEQMLACRELIAAQPAYNE